jgi:hypothetical protein
MDNERKKIGIAAGALRTRNRLMHDGLSFTKQEAIQRHQGQAEGVTRAYNALRDDQNTEKRFPSSEHPIVQSYVDVCLDGCLEIEAMYPLARQANFAEQFVKTTSNWQPPWINDRIYPWRPFVYVPRASQIDALIQKVLGKETFAKITLK